MPSSTDNPRQNVTFPSNGRQAHGYLVIPESGHGPGVVVIQEWWGLTDQVVRDCDRLARHGFVVLAPDLYGGPTTHDAEEADRLMQELPVERAVRDLAGAVDFLLGRSEATGDKVGAVGFCMGGGFVIHLAAAAGDKLAAVVCFYGLIPGGEPDLSGIAAPVLGHFGETDDYAPPGQARDLERRIREQAGVEVNFYVYDGKGHAFFNEDNLLGTYDQQAAELAGRRSVDFLHAHLG